MFSRTDGQVRGCMRCRHQHCCLPCCWMFWISPGARFRCFRAWSTNAAVNSFDGSNSEMVKPSSHVSRPHEKQCNRARFTFQFVISTRSDPHSHKSSIATSRSLPRGEQKRTQRPPFLRAETSEHGCPDTTFPSLDILVINYRYITAYSHEW